MVNVDERFHALSIFSAAKTRCRIYFIQDSVNCWDDADVQTNGTLLVGAAGDTDSNGRIGQDGVTINEIFNKDQNISIGGTVSYQIGFTVLNADRSLDSFAFGRCKVYLDVWDDTAQDWLACPMGVYKIDLPVKRRVQLISCSGYDQMQVLNAIADTWWNGLNFTGGLTIESILNSMVTQLGLHLSAASSTSMVNKTLSFTTPPIDSVERTYRDILGWIAEATGTVAHFNRDGELDMRQYLTPQIGGNNIVIDTDTTGNQCLSIDVAEYSVSQIDALTIKLTTADQGVTVGSGTNVYTIMDNPFLYGPDVATIQGKLTPIYNRLSAYATYSPISTRLIYDWSIEAGDIIYILNNSTTYNMPIFQQKMTWRGGYVTSELISSGDTVRPQVSSGERETYRYNVEMATKVGDNEIISKINQTAEQIQIQASKVNLTGYITATNLATPGQTVINGGNITTGSISADRIQGGIMTVGGLNNTNGYIRILDSTGNYSGGIGANGITVRGIEPSAQSHVAYNYMFPEGISIMDNTTSKQMLNAGFYVADSTDEYASIYLQGYDNGTQVSSAQLYAYPYNSGAYLLLKGPGGVLTRLSADGTYTSDLTISDGDLTVYGDTLINNNATINGVLDVTKRRSYARLSSPGWYRVMKLTGSNIYEADGAGGFIVDFNIVRNVDTTNNEAHKISLMATWGNIKFINEQSFSNVLGITKIRTTNSGSNLFVDVYYELSTGNTVTVAFNVACQGGNEGKFVSQPFTNVFDSSPGETVLSEYTFIGASGAKNTFTPSHGTPAFGGCWYSRNGEYVTVHVGLTDITANTNHIIGTLPVGYRPVSQCCASGSSATYEQQAHLYVRENGNIDVWSPNTMASLDATYMWR